MKKITVFLTLALMLLGFTGFALQETGAIELGDATSLVEWLAPVIVWAATAIAKPLLKLPGWVTLTIAVPLLAFAVTYFTGNLEGEGLSWIQQFIYTLSAVFINEVKKKLQPDPLATQ